MTTVEATRLADRKYYRKNKKKFIDYQREYRRKIRLEAIDVYGGKCKCCNEAQRQFLVFDHMNGGGSKDWRRKKRGNGWYNHLIKDHPKDIQLLCHNCNAAKFYYGQCPHQQEAKSINSSENSIKEK